MSRAIESQIISDLRSSLSEICDVLSSLDIAIGFLSSSGGQTRMPLKWYLHEVLKLPRDRGLRSPSVSRGKVLNIVMERVIIGIFSLLKGSKLN